MLIDTSGFLCAVDARDRRHLIASYIYNAAKFRLTHSFVLTELISLAASRGFSRTAILEFVDEIIVDESIEIIWVDDVLTSEAIALLKKRSDKKWSLCDAVSFLIMDQSGMVEALTSDHHFEQAGFVQLLESS